MGDSWWRERSGTIAGPFCFSEAELFVSVAPESLAAAHQTCADFSGIFSFLPDRKGGIAFAAESTHALQASS